jgi:class 3 adenylate cyclase
MVVAAWLASMLAVRRRRNARSHFTSMTLLAKEEGRADWVLGLMLPHSVIDLLKSGADHCAATFDEVSVLFVEIVDFDSTCQRLPAADLVELLNFVFTVFDTALETFGPQVYKVETVGAVYVVSAGVPEPNPDHCKTLALLALSLNDKLDEALNNRPQLPRVRIKMGLQSGSVVGGVIGIKHPRYRLFGDIVNTAARMETRSDPGRLHVAAEAAEILKRSGLFRMTDRGESAVKGKGIMRTHFVDRLELAADAMAAETSKVTSALACASHPTLPGWPAPSPPKKKSRERWCKIKVLCRHDLLGAMVQTKQDDLMRDREGSHFKSNNYMFDQWVGHDDVTGDGAGAGEEGGSDADESKEEAVLVTKSSASASNGGDFRDSDDTNERGEGCVDVGDVRVLINMDSEPGACLELPIDARKIDDKGDTLGSFDVLTRTSSIGFCPAVMPRGGIADTQGATADESSQTVPSAVPDAPRGPRFSMRATSMPPAHGSQGAREDEASQRVPSAAPDAPRGPRVSFRTTSMPPDHAYSSSKKHDALAWTGSGYSPRHVSPEEVAASRCHARLALQRQTTRIKRLAVSAHRVVTRDFRSRSAHLRANPSPRSSSIASDPPIRLHQMNRTSSSITNSSIGSSTSGGFGPDRTSDNEHMEQSTW